ncbi:hypothetical protein AB5N19_07956 [Seiridium cardinale]
MATNDHIAKFNRCYANADKYPLNLSQYSSNNGGLLAHWRLLKENAARLFLMKSDIVALELKKADVPENSIPLKRYRTDDEVNSWLARPDPARNTSASDIRCRFIFIQAASSQAKLNLTLSHAKSIFTYFQVTPSYIDFISVFTVNRSDEADVSDLRFSSFRERARLGAHSNCLSLPHLALSGKGFQLSYNLKCVSNTTRESPTGWSRIANTPEEWQWSTRQAVFHHQFDMKEGTTLWILTAARNYLQKRVQKLVGQNGTQTASSTNDEDNLQPRSEDRSFTTPGKSFISSLSVHLMIAQYASEDWRGYLRWLEQMLEKKTKEALISEKYNPREFDLINVQIMEDKTNRAAMTLTANAKVLESLADFYEGLMQNVNFELRGELDCKTAIADFLVQLRDYIYDMKMFSERAHLLAKITADRKILVQERLQTRASDRVENLTIQQQMEAKIMRVIAVLTLIYLPATFVSTFFSTDVVKYQPDGDNSDSSTDNSSQSPPDYTSYSALALERWFEVTVPLTLLTFAVALGWYCWYEPAKKATKEYRRANTRHRTDSEKQLLPV